MGIISPTKKTINGLKRVLALPCATPPGVYVETALEALASILWSLYSPDFKEAYHQLTGHSLLCSAKGVLKHSTVIPPKETSAATRFFFSSAEWFDRATWYIFIAQIINDSLIDWESQLIALSKCRDGLSPLVASGTWFFGAIHDDGEWGTEDYTAQAGSIYYPVWGSGPLIVKPGKAYSIACSQGFHNFEGESVPVSARIINKTHNVLLDSYSVTKDQAQGAAKTHVWIDTRNETVDTIHVYCEWSYTGDPLTDHEAFGDHDGTGFAFVQP